MLNHNTTDQFKQFQQEDLEARKRCVGCLLKTIQGRLTYLFRAVSAIGEGQTLQANRPQRPRLCDNFFFSSPVPSFLGSFDKVHLSHRKTGFIFHCSSLCCRCIYTYIYLYIGGFFICNYSRNIF